MKQFVKEYVKGCAICQENKPRTHHKKAPLQPLPVEPKRGPFQSVSMDLITDLPPSQGYNAILTIVDQGCTKAAKFIPCTTNITGEGVATLYFRHLIPWFGVPRKIISDRDPRFVSNFTRELCRLLHIEQNVSTAFHPRTDGQSERTNQWVEQYLRLWVADDQTTWAEYLTLAEYVHNSWPHDRSGLTPHELLFGTKPTLPDNLDESDVPAVQERLLKLHENRERATKAFQTATTTPQTQFEEGDKVWLEGRNLKTHHMTNKLAPRRYGPFLITQKLSPVTYRLQLPPGMHIHPVFHIDLLSHFHDTEAHGHNYPRPPPDVIDGEPEWEVEKITQSRLHGRRRELQFRVRWKGFPSSEDSWVSQHDIHAPDLIEQFYQTHPNATKASRRRRP
jgi:Chromo (CHRromatin Organisation MOdifier) domain